MRASSEAASRAGRAVKSSRTSLEERVYARIKAEGLRRPRRNFRPAALGISLDFWWPAARVAVQAHGCFWHSCPREARPIPKANAGYWAGKFEANRERDKRQARKLRRAGVSLVVIWEHEDPRRAIRRVARLLSVRSPFVAR